MPANNPFTEHALKTGYEERITEYVGGSKPKEKRIAPGIPRPGKGRGRAGWTGNFDIG
jgi:hypothetical protein